MASAKPSAVQNASNHSMNKSPTRFCERRFIRVNGRQVVVTGDERAFAAEVVVGVTLHNQADPLRDCLASIGAQREEPLPLPVLVLHDDSTDAWRLELEKHAPRFAVAVANTRCGSAARARNCLLDVADTVFPSTRWVARLDADDRFASPESLGAAVRLALVSNACFVLGGNRLRHRGQLLGRANPATLDLLRPDYVMSRLARMAHGEPEAELPSCNLLLATSESWRYPEQTSAEDHWLVAELLLRHPEKGAVLTEPFYADYTLEGAVTSENQRQSRHRSARRSLWQAAQRWVG